MKMNKINKKMEMFLDRRYYITRYVLAILLLITLIIGVLIGAWAA